MLAIGVGAENRGYSPHAEGLFEKGAKAYRAGHFGRSQVFFQELLNLAPNQRTSATRLLMGKILFRSEEYEGALLHLKKLQRDFGNSRYGADAILLAGDCYYMLRRYYEASTQYGRLLATASPLIIQAMAAERLSAIVSNRLITAQALDNIRMRVGPSRMEEAGQVSRMLSNGIGDGSPRAVQAAQVSMRLCG